jgi:hypothetical protein
MASMDALLRITAKGDASGLGVVTRGLQQVEKAGQEVNRGIGGIGSVLGSLTGGIVALGAGLSAAGLVAFAKSAIDAADDMRDLSQRTGVTVENLSRFDQAAKMSGTSIESVGSAMVKLSRGLSAAAATGAGPAADALKTLGISAVDAAGRLRGADEVMLEVSDRFAQLPDGAQKATLAVQLFGKSGAELIPLLNEGRQAIEGLDASMSSAFADKADEYNDSLTALGTVFGQIGMAIAEELLPYLSSTVDWLTRVGIGFRDWIVANREPIRQTIETIGTIGKAIAPWVAGIGLVVVAYQGLTIALKAAAAAQAFLQALSGPKGWAALAVGAGAATAAVWAMNKAFEGSEAKAAELAEEVDGARASTELLEDSTAAAAAAAAEHKRQVEEAKAQQEAFNVAVQQSNAQYELLSRTIDATSQALQGQSRLRDAVLTADIAVNNAAKSILESKLAQARTDAEKIPILKQIQGIELENARLQKVAAEEQIAAEVRITDLKRQKAWQELRSAQAALATAEAYGQQTARLQEQVNLMKIAANSADSEFKLQQQIANEKRRANDATFQAQQTQILSRQIAAPAQMVNPAGGARPMGYINGVPYWSQTPGFATGAYVTGPTRAVFGEAGPEYAIPERSMAAASVAYLSGARGAAVLQGAAIPSPGSSAATGAIKINIQTGPVLQQDGQDWVSMDDLDAALNQFSRQLMGQLRTPAARIALGG